MLHVLGSIGSTRLRIAALGILATAARVASAQSLPPPPVPPENPITEPKRILGKIHSADVAEHVLDGGDRLREVGFGV